MTPTEQTELRVKLAEWAGWKRTVLPCELKCMVDESKGIVFCKWDHPELRPIDDEPGFDPYHGQLTLPNYPASLDAVAELEARLTDEQWERYRVELIESLMETKGYSARRLLSATALQRCLALKATLGL
jgi:hypothetical protein